MRARAFADNGRVPGALEGIRVVDLTHFAAGPLCTSLLADQGADVLKIEPVAGGDPMRRMGSRRGGTSSIFTALNRGKRSLAIDLGRARGAELVRALAERADVFAQSLRPGVAARLGLGCEQLRAAAPQLVYLSISGWGERGPLAGRRAYDSLVQAHSGMAALQAGADGVPRMVGSAVCDKLTGVYAAQAVTAALLARARGAGGQHVQLAMLDASVSFLWSDGMQELAWVGASASRRARRPPIRAARDGWVSFTANSDAEFAALCAAMDRPALAADPRFASVESRARHAEPLDAELERWAAGLDARALLERLAAHDVPAVRVNQLADLFEDPQIAASELLREVDEPGAGRLRLPRHAARFAATPAREPSPAPGLGEHTAEVLAELGLDADAIGALRADGTVR
jgi:crotonobetainyl-CoA:carnitine CoA-transferase CaiB-like acyl-CoA transferase